MSYTNATAAGRRIAMGHATTAYQVNLLRGAEAWSGATLQGKAAEYGGSYKRTRERLMDRLCADRSLSVRETREAYGKRVVWICTAEEAAAESAVAGRPLNARQAIAQMQERAEAKDRAEAERDRAYRQDWLATPKREGVPVEDLDALAAL